MAMFRFAWSPLHVSRHLPHHILNLKLYATACRCKTSCKETKMT